MSRFAPRINRRQTLAMLAAATAVQQTGRWTAGSATARADEGPTSDRSATDAGAAEEQRKSTTRQASGQNWVAATVHPIATAAAQAAFQRGGNAFDAAVAAALTLGVVDGHNSGLGGGCFVLGRTADGKVFAIDGRETAPALASGDMFVRDGKPDPQLSQVGALASGVPGQVAALARLSLGYGAGGWSAACEHAASIAHDGYAITASTANAIRNQRRELAMFPTSAAVLLAADGSPPPVGTRLHQPDLGRTLQSLASEGPDWFYRGPFAEQCQQWMASNGGMLAAGDFASYVAKSRQPLQTAYRQWTVCGFPPPSSGGIHIAQMLMMLEAFPVRDLYNDSPVKALHLVTEVMKRAFADRAFWLGDADFVDVPRGLIDPEYCRQLAATIDLDKPTPVLSHGQPPRTGEGDLFSRQHTTHLTTADRAGNWVAITNTVNTTFGSCVMIPGTGVMLNNEMDDFSISPGTPNAFGLIGAENNAIQPGKRPLSSMSPTIVLDASGQPRLTCGAAGGPRIISATLQCLLRVLDQGQTVGQAVAEPRIHHQWSPDQVLMEPSWPDEIVDAYTAMGHQLSRRGNVAITQAIERTEDGQLHAASDPRVASSALGG